MRSGTQSAVLAAAPVLAAVTAVFGILLPASAAVPAGYPQIHRIRPVITLQQCERAGGVVEAMSNTKAVCIGGLDNGDPVVGE